MSDDIFKSFIENSAKYLAHWLEYQQGYWSKTPRELVIQFELYQILKSRLNRYKALSGYDIFDEITYGKINGTKNTFRADIVIAKKINSEADLSFPFAVIEIKKHEVGSEAIKKDLIKLEKINKTIASRYLICTADKDFLEKQGGIFKKSGDKFSILRAKKKLNLPKSKSYCFDAIGSLMKAMNTYKGAGSYIFSLKLT